MKVNTLDAHDRRSHFIEDQSQTVWQGATDCLTKNQLSIMLQERSPYVYIFAHPRTADDGVNKRMLWQPRLTKPKAETNSYLFRANSKTDIVEICWLIPPREMWPQYEKGKVCESNWTAWSIDQFQNNREYLQRPLEDDLSDDKIKAIYREIDYNMKIQNVANKRII